MNNEGIDINSRIGFLMAVVVLAMTALIMRLWHVQINEHEKWVSKLRKSSQDIVRIPAPRGEIKDRNGIVLVENRANYKVDFYLTDIEDNYRQSGKTVPINTYQARVRGHLRDLTEPDIVKIVHSEVIEPLEKAGLAKDWNTKSLRMHYRQRKFVPFTYMQDIDFETIARLSERTIGAAGLEVAISPVRHYVYKSLACHVLGYTGQIKELEKEPDIGEYTRAGYAPDEVGVSQVELLMDKYLRGKPGRRVLQRNPKGVIEGEVDRIEPVEGASVFLTIDVRVQSIVEKALRVVGRGAAVVVNPNNGDILAMASVPSFDPNKFIPSIPTTEWERLNADKTHPLTNRALLAYAPGSTYKIPIAMAGMSVGLGTNTYLNCAGAVTYGNKAMKCWIADKGGAHGTLGLVKAIKTSCNAYFYQYGNRAGPDVIVNIGTALGLGQLSGLGLIGESPGILPGREWLAANYPNERWTSGYTANTSIGQGFVLASPLQMAMVTAAVANGGISYYPRLIDKVVDVEGKIILNDPPRVRADLKTMGLTPSNIESIRKGMYQVVNTPGGTASRARLRGVNVAGKTGTAQIWRRDERNVRVKDNHVWFICFAPYDKPSLAVCVLVANGKAGGSVAAPIAARIIDETLALERGFQPEITALEPAKGNFRFFDSIAFRSSVPGNYAIVGGDGTPLDGEDEETADHVESRTAERAEVGIMPEPRLQADPDEGGRVKKRGFFQRLGDSIKKPFQRRDRSPRTR